MRLIIATKNQHKLQEMKLILAHLPMEVLGLDDLGIEDDVEETGSTFQENACIKAMAISKLCDDLVLADDSGIEIDALDKQPGIYSARYLGHQTPYEEKNQTILSIMEHHANRLARFVCAIAICQKGELLHIVEDTFEGEISDKVLGEHGFGYDPIFYYPPMQKGAAEMTAEEKNAVSHRGKAMQQAMRYLQGYLDV